jgi:hypothetical protein
MQAHIPTTRPLVRSRGVQHVQAVSKQSFSQLRRARSPRGPVRHAIDAMVNGRMSQ